MESRFLNNRLNCPTFVYKFFSVSQKLPHIIFARLHQINFNSKISRRKTPNPRCRLLPYSSDSQTLFTRVLFGGIMQCLRTAYIQKISKIYKKRLRIDLLTYHLESSRVSQLGNYCFKGFAAKRFKKIPIAAILDCYTQSIV